MGNRKRKDVEAALERKGFMRKDGDHNYFVYHRRISGKKTAIFTKTSHSGLDLNDFLLGQMAKQCRLSKKDFIRLVDCPLDRQTYEGMVLPTEEDTPGS
jgi:hypothetical protein